MPDACPAPCPRLTEHHLTAMNTHLLLPAAALAAALTAAAHAAVDPMLQRQLEAQQRTMLDMQQQMKQMSSDMAGMRGELERMRHDLQQQAQSSQSTAANASAMASQAARGGMATVAPGAREQLAAEADRLQPADEAARLEYEKAYDLIRRNDLDRAAAAFQEYVRRYPSNSLTPNGWYWLGQVQYNKSQLTEARVSFLNVARFNHSQKRPDALYKLGIISKLTGESDKARKYFQLVMESYPNEAVASLAGKELN